MSNKEEGLQIGYLLESLLPYRISMMKMRPWLPQNSASAPSMLPSSTIHDHYSETGQPSRYILDGDIFPTALEAIIGSVQFCRQSE